MHALTSSVAGPVEEAPAARARARSLLRHAADRRSLAFAGVHFALVGAAFVFAPGGLVGAALVTAITFSAFLQLVSGHNAMHSPVFHRRALNRGWQIVLSLAFGYPVSAFVPVHNLSHHMRLQTPGDVLRTTEVRHRHNLLNLLHHTFSSTVHIHVLNAAYARANYRRQSAWFRQMRLELVAVLCFIACLVALDPGRFLRFVLLPYFLGQCMIIGLGYLQHDGCDPESSHDHSRNFVGGLFNWLIFGNGYHTIHHLKPGLHWSLAREGHEATVLPRIHPALNEPSVLAYMWKSYVWPARRLRYDGRPVEFASAPRRREIWMPDSPRSFDLRGEGLEG